MAGDFSPPVHPIHATRARVLTASGDLAGAAAWGRQHALGPGDEISYLREYEHLTLARMLLAQHRAGEPGREPGLLAEATELLERLRTAAEEGGRVGTVIEVEVLLAGHITRPVTPTGGSASSSTRSPQPRGCSRCSPHGNRRPATSGSSWQPQARARKLSGRPAPRSTASLGLPHRVRRPSPREAAAAGAVGGALADALSQRELDVLRFLGSDLDGPAITRELVVSLNTIRTHTKHIYTKLGVNNRRAAVSKAHQLGLLARSGRR